MTNFCNHPFSASDKLTVDSLVLLVCGLSLIPPKREKECLFKIVKEGFYRSETNLRLNGNSMLDSR